MNIHKILPIGIVIFCLFLTLCEKESHPSSLSDSEILGNLTKPEIIDEYIYPIQPGTPGWKALQNYAEMMEACRIPDSVLGTISTWGLVETCFKYPLGGDNLAMNCPSVWINNLSGSFNGLNELYSRTDVTLILLYNFRYMDFSKYRWFYWQYIELIVGCDAFLSKLNHRQLLYLMAVAMEKSKEQAEYYETGFSHTCYILANAMIHAGYKPFINYCKTKNCLDSAGVYMYCHCDEKIEEYASDFIRN